MMNSALQEESMKFERVTGTERTIMKRYILAELGTLVLSSAGSAERVPEADAVLFDVYGYSDIMKRLGKCYSFRQAARILEEIGVGELFALCNAPQLFATIKELVDIRCRLKVIQKQNRKSGKNSLRKEEAEYLTDIYKSAIKAFRKRLGLKKSTKYRYKTRYGGISALLEDNQSRGWSIYDEDYMDDEDDYGIGTADFSNYASFAKRCGYRTSIDRILGGSVVSRRSRPINPYPDDDDEEEEYDLYEKSYRPVKKNNLSLYPEYEEEDEVRRKPDSWKSDIEDKIDQLADTMQRMLANEPFRTAPQPVDPIQTQIQQLSVMVNQLVAREQTRGSAQVPMVPAMTVEDYARLKEDQKIRHSQSIVNDDDDDEMELYSPDEKARRMNFSPAQLSDTAVVEQEFQRRLQAKQRPHPNVYANQMRDRRLTERDLYEAEDDDDDSPLTMDEIETLSTRLTADEVRMLMRSELNADEQQEMVTRHPELQQIGVEAPQPEVVDDPVPGEPVEVQTPDEN